MTYNVTLTTGTWHQIFYVYDSGASTLTLYIDGVNGGSVSSSGTGTGGCTADFSLGATNGGGNKLSGQIDEVGAWKKALSQQEITDLYNGGAGQTIQAGFLYTASSTFVTPGTYATTSFSGTTGRYHWSARVVDTTDNAASNWQDFGPNPTSTDFTMSPIAFTYPVNGTSTR